MQLGSQLRSLAFSKANVASLSGFKNAFKRVQKQLLGAVILTVHCVSGNCSSVVCAMMSEGTKQGGNVVDLLKHTPRSSGVTGSFSEARGWVWSWGVWLQLGLRWQHKLLLAELRALPFVPAPTLLLP